MESAKEQMAKDLVEAMVPMQCVVMVIRSKEHMEPAFLLIFPESTTMQSVVDVDRFAAGGPLPPKALAVVDLRGEVVTVMVSASIEPRLRDGLQDAVMACLRANASIQEVAKGTVKPAAERRGMN